MEVRIVTTRDALQFARVYNQKLKRRQHMFHYMGKKVYIMEARSMLEHLIDQKALVGRFTDEGQFTSALRQLQLF